MNDLRRDHTWKTLFDRKAYKYLKGTLLAIYILFMLVYMSRENLYQIDNHYITLFAWTAPNLIPSFLFTLIGIFYIVPILYKTTKIINNLKFILLINIVNMSVFILIEYLHVILNLGVWDNKDMIASFFGIIIATIVYLKFKKFFI
jgi:hypothetical protein